MRNLIDPIHTAPLAVVILRNIRAKDCDKPSPCGPRLHCGLFRRDQSSCPSVPQPVRRPPTPPLSSRARHPERGGPAGRHDFIRTIVRDDLASGRITAPRTRFPAGTQRLPAHRPRQVHLPELRHRAEFGGSCNLRFDDTNPHKEDPSTSRPSRTTCSGWASSGMRYGTRRTTSTSSTCAPKSSSARATRSSAT
jgi:hypothetical protein